MAGQWHYQHDGQNHGPATGAELKELAAAGKLLPTDLIWKEGMDKWVPARSVKGLFPAGSGAESQPVMASPIPAERTAPAPTQAIPRSLPPPLPDEEGDGDGGLPEPRTPRGPSRRRLAIGGAAAGLVVLGIVGLVLLLRGGSTADAAVEVRVLDAEYRKDKVAAGKKYEKRRVVVRGVVESVLDNVRDTGADTITVCLETDEKFDVVFAEFDKAFSGRFRKGDTITFEATVSGSSKSCRLSNCKTIEKAVQPTPSGRGGEGQVGSGGTTKADFIKRLRSAAGPSKIGLQDGAEDWSDSLRTAVGPIPRRAKPDGLHERYSFPTKQEFLSKLGQPDETESLRDQVPFELLGSVATEALTYRCSDGRLRLEISHSGWYEVLRVRDLR